MVLSHAIDRPRCTDRQLLGDEILLSSFYFLRTRKGFAFASGWDSGLEIPRLVSLARDDRQGKTPRPRGLTRSLPSCQRCRTLESRRLTLTVIPTEPAGRLEGSPTRNPSH